MKNSTTIITSDTKRIASLKRKRVSLLSRVAAIDKELAELTVPHDFKAGIIAFLFAADKAMTTAEILPHFFSPEELAIRGLRRRRIMQLSLILSRLCDKGKLESRDLIGKKGKTYTIATSPF